MFSGIAAKWDICSVYNLWEPVCQVCVVPLIIYFNAVLLTTFKLNI